MISRSLPARAAGLMLGLAGLLAGTLPGVLAQDTPAAKTQKLSAEGIQFEVPAAWKSGKPSGTMRKAQVQVPPVDGDREPAELVLFVFGGSGGGGSVDANIERWRKQFTDADGDTPPVESKKVKVGNLEATRVEVSGSYKDPFAPGGPREGFRLLGAIVVTKEAGYFFKMVGPYKTMKAIAPDFDRMIASFQTGQ